MIVADKIVEGLIENSQGNFHHGFTYTNSPLSAAVGLAVLEVMEKKDLVKRSREMGEYLLGRLNELSEKHPSIGEVRGKGLHLGVEFVKDRATKEPFPADAAFADRLKTMAQARGVLFFVGRGFIDGTLGDQLFLCPPLIISRDEAEEIISVLDESLSQLEAELL